MRNPFEEKRKNDRINRLAKENEELKIALEKAENALDGKDSYIAGLESAIKWLELTSKEATAKLEKVAEHIKSANDIINHERGKEVEGE